jgi:hypothetical protein
MSRKKLLASFLSLLGLLSAGSSAATMLANGDFSLGNSGFSTGYSYISPTGGWSYAGQFTVGSDPNAFMVLGSSFGDHTSGSGLMMIVDGSTSRATVWQENITVTPGSTYDFTGWTSTPAGGTFDPYPAQLRFYVNGDAVGDYSVLPTDAKWSQFSITWRADTGTNATIRIVDMNTSAVGNDFVLDDLSVRAVSAVPEPSRALLLLVGGGALFVLSRKRSRVTG